MAELYLIGYRMGQCDREKGEGRRQKAEGKSWIGAERQATDDRCALRALTDGQKNRRTEEIHLPCKDRYAAKLSE